VANLPPVLLWPRVHLDVRISAQIKTKIKRPLRYNQEHGGRCFMKKPEVKNLVKLSL
jgi:hypothetical protein